MTDKVLPDLWAKDGNLAPFWQDQLTHLTDVLGGDLTFGHMCTVIAACKYDQSGVVLDPLHDVWEKLPGGELYPLFDGFYMALGYMVMEDKKPSDVLEAFARSRDGSEKSNGS